jgi:hypothetical protein
MDIAWSFMSIINLFDKAFKHGDGAKFCDMLGQTLNHLV